jgi:hypothetical protein
MTTPELHTRHATDPDDISYIEPRILDEILWAASGDMNGGQRHHDTEWRDISSRGGRHKSRLRPFDSEVQQSLREQRDMEVPIEELKVIIAAAASQGFIKKTRKGLWKLDPEGKDRHGHEGRLKRLGQSVTMWGR